MYINLSKKFITKNLLPHLSQTNLGRRSKIPLWRVLKAIIYRLKSGCQWRELPMKSFCREKLMSWNTVYYHFRKWTKDGSWKVLWMKLLELQKVKLDLSSIQLDGSHTIAKRGGEVVAYQGRKKAKTTNALFLTDKQGIPLAMSEPFSGNHNDLFGIEFSLTKMITDMELSNIAVNGLFLNADAGFDSKKVRAICDVKGIIPHIDKNKRNNKKADNQHLIDTLLYKERFAVERTNAWLDTFKALLIRFETTANSWTSLHYLAFAIILAKKKTNLF